MKYESISIGSGNTIVEFFSVEIVFSVYGKNYATCTKAL